MARARNAGVPAEAARDTVRQLLDGIEEHQRSAFAATQLAGLSYAEAATRAGCPVGTIRSRVARARAHLLDEVRRIDAV